MQIEIELKILEINVPEIIKVLENIGAEKSFEGEIEDIYFDFKKDKMDKKSRSFRLRSFNGKSIYTIKKQLDKNGTKKALEFESKVTDLKGFLKTLEKYGLQEVEKRQKYRISYKLENMSFDIDKYANFPAFLEIESDNDEDIKIWVKKLGLENAKQKPWGFGKLKKYYSKK